MIKAIQIFSLLAFANQLIVLPASGTVPPRPGDSFSPGVKEHLQDHEHVSVVKRGLKERLWRAKAKREAIGSKAESLTETERVSSGMVVSGNVPIAVLPTFFTPVTTPPPPSIATIDTVLFSGGAGTVTDYYDEVSYGFVNVIGDVLPYVTLPNADTYYEGPSGCNGLCNLSNVGQLLLSALNGADPGVDFGLYDNDGPDNMPNSGDDDGFVDLVAILHAEDGGECGTFNIWAHRWVYSGWWGLGNVYTTNDPRTGGGNIQIDDYTIQGAQGCGGGTPLEIGTFAHETGHIFGLPDLYDTQGSSPSQGLGDISLMASGSWNTQSSPAHMSAWEKAELGWITPTLLTNPVATAINIDQVETIPEAYQIVVGNGEYFLIENRQTVGFDINLKTCGLAIYHVDQATAVSQLSYNQVNRYQNCGVFVEQAQAHYGVALEQADGLCQLEANVNRGDSGDLFPGSTNNTSFDSSTNPNSDAYSFATTVAVNGISACGATMTANVSALPVLPDPGVGVDVVFLIDNSGSYFNDYPNINAQMPDIVTALGASFSDIRFGLAIFRDFPFAPFGQPGDEAYELRQSLTGNATTFLTAMNDLTINKPPSGGGDFPEAQYEAFYQTLTGLGRDLDGNTISGDSSGEISPSNMGWGIGRHRIVYLLTDADFHDSDTESYPGTPLEAIGRNAVRNLITTTYPPNVLTLFVMVAENSGAYINQGQRGDVFNDPPTALFEQSNELTVLTGGGVMGVGNDSSGLEDMVGISIIVLENSDINSGRAVPVLGPVALGLMIGGIGGLGAAIARARRRQA